MADLGDGMRARIDQLTLGCEALAEAPNGTRLIGEVMGMGTQGVVMRTVLGSHYLAYDDGWSVRAVSDSPEAPAHEVDDAIKSASARTPS